MLLGQSKLIWQTMLSTENKVQTVLNIYMYSSLVFRFKRWKISQKYLNNPVKQILFYVNLNMSAQEHYSVK